jgi:Ca2+-binding EF-hand superfamily protein
MNRSVAVTSLLFLSASAAVVAGAALADGRPGGNDFGSLDANGDGVLQRGEAPVGDYLFGRGDRNGDGVLDRGEAREVQRLARIGKKVASKNGELLRKFGEADKNQDGVIQRDEFPAPDELFERFDRDGDGQVVRDEALAYAVEEELGKVYAEYDADLSGTLEPGEVPENRREVVRAADSDGDGAVTGEEAFAFVYELRRDPAVAQAAPSGSKARPKASATPPSALDPADAMDAPSAAQAAVGKLGVIGALRDGFQRADADGDGQLRGAEFPASQGLRVLMDVDGDGAVSQAELRLRLRFSEELAARGERLQRAAQELGVEGELAIPGAEIQALFLAGRYEEVRRLVDRVELQLERAREGN